MHIFRQWWREILRAWFSNNTSSSSNQISRKKYATSTCLFIFFPNVYVIGWLQVAVFPFFFLQGNKKLHLEKQPQSFSIITKKPINFIYNPTDSIRGALFVVLLVVVIFCLWVLFLCAVWNQHNLEWYFNLLLWKGQQLVFNGYRMVTCNPVPAAVTAVLRADLQHLVSGTHQCSCLLPPSLPVDRPPPAAGTAPALGE